jgi:hypothetical protein
MTSGQQSKAQRRAESQRKAAERRAAEQRAKRMRTTLRAGGVVALLAVIVLIVVLVTGGSSGPKATPPTQKNPHVKTEAIPASLTMVTAPAGKAGPEVVPIETGTPLATLSNAATGQDIDGIQCQDGEQTVTHVHSHLAIFVDGQERKVPYGIGIPGFQGSDNTTTGDFFVSTGSCFYWLHTHANDGIIHIESPSLTSHFTLGQFFAEWGIPLSSTQVGPAQGKVTVFFASPGKKFGIYKGDPADLPLGDHYEIQLDVGTPIVAPVDITNWGSL